MDKASFIDGLYDELKDKIEFDEDVEALSKILIATLQIDRKLSQNRWLYIMQRYNLKTLKEEIDFYPLIENYLKKYLDYTNLKELLNLISLLPINNKIIVDNIFMNTFNQNSYLYQYFKKNILAGKFEKELLEIKMIISSYNNNKYIFSETNFLKNIILIHINTNKINLEYLLKLTNIPQCPKAQSLLKSLLIDYI